MGSGAEDLKADKQYTVNSNPDKGVDTFKLHSVQIRDLEVRQAQLREWRAVLESSWDDAHKSEISTRNRFAPLRETGHDAVIIVESIFRHVRATLAEGVSGVDYVHVFISSGEDVRLSCNNALHDCKSTTWLFNRFSNSATVELIALGTKKKDTESHERLSLGSDCSLNIRNISTEDYGSYICQQWTSEGGERLAPDTGVYLHVLHVSSSHTEISAGLSVTLFCQLYSYPRVSCDDSGHSKRIDLFWVNQAGVKSDSRLQISSSSDHCIISLNKTLLNEDHNREWRCEVTERDQVKSSVTYTVKSSARADTTTEPSHTKVAVISVSVAAIAVLLAAVLWLIWRKRAGDSLILSFLTIKNSSDLTLMISRQEHQVQIVCYYRNMWIHSLILIHLNVLTKYHLLWNLMIIITVNIQCFIINTHIT
ncbi:vascular endothelial growth factor receptor 1-like [Carassius auratus]|uniref:Vascular endothelial growth factor receptor 1-like n=1 Tax=Carassius auratus TaxID=7957 RepID=A0A6P6NQA3_CARAU|nr:vascular endothelial growth factor receptor 1-like [Carassius auratus]